MAKRVFDVTFSLLGLFFLAPIFLLIAAAIKIESKGAIFFRQERVGLNGKPFYIHKFRTMQQDAPLKGPQITVQGDARITRVGRFLRKYKLDELAQLIDVLFGDMSFVGPRPEVPHYVALYTTELRSLVLSVKPGITDRASIEFKDENGILSRSKEPQKTYVNEIIPIKLQFAKQYVQERSFWGDIKIIFATLKALVN